MRTAYLALLSTALSLIACGPASQESASEGTTVATRHCDGPPVVTQAEGGVFITYCGATTYAPAAALAGHIPWAQRR